MCSKSSSVSNRKSVSNRRSVSNQNNRKRSIFGRVRVILPVRRVSCHFYTKSENKKTRILNTFGQRYGKIKSTVMTETRFSFVSKVLKFKTGPLVHSSVLCFTFTQKSNVSPTRLFSASFYPLAQQPKVTRSSIGARLYTRA